MVSVRNLEEVETIENQLATVAGKSGGDFKTKVQYLKLIKKYKLRRSENVFRLGLELLNSPAFKRMLGGELWDIYEQVAIAAMDCSCLEVAKECIGALMQRFPESVRVGKLEGMWFEASDRWSDAEAVYKNLLEEAPNDPALHKRKVAVLKGQGDLTAAVEALNAYLHMFMADEDAWRELGELYLSLQMYKQAAFCYEELLLWGPTNSLYHQTYADVCYTMGGLENMRIARKYYAAALEFSGGRSMHALYGVVLSTAAAAALSKGTKAATKEGTSASPSELHSLAAKVIEKEYKDSCSNKAQLVTNIVNKLVASSI